MCMQHTHTHSDSDSTLTYMHHIIRTHTQTNMQHTSVFCERVAYSHIMHACVCECTPFANELRVCVCIIIMRWPAYISFFFKAVRRACVASICPCICYLNTKARLVAYSHSRRWRCVCLCECALCACMCVCMMRVKSTRKAE